MDSFSAPNFVPTPKSKKLESFNLISMVDVIFILLIFFLLSASFLPPAMKVNLPHADTGSNMPTKKIITLAISKDGNYYLEKNKMELDQISNYIQHKMNKDSALIIHSDKNSRFDHFIQLLDVLRKHNIENFSIGHQ